MAPSARLLTRLLVAATSALACSSSTDLPASTDPCTPLSCAAGDTCSYPSPTKTGQVGPTASVWCSCGTSGKFDCQASPIVGISTTTVTACYYDGADKPCLTVSDNALPDKLREHHTTDCPSLVVAASTRGPTVGKRSDGAPACCYDVAVGYCAGRPVIVEGAARLAGLVRRAGWRA